MGIDQQSTEPLSAQGIVVYKLLYDQIDSLKKQQWTITNYIALLYGAIFVLAKELALSSEQRNLLIGSTVVAGVYGILALLKVQNDLKKARKRLDKANKKIFGSLEYSQLGMTVGKHPFISGLFFTFGLILVLIIGLGLLVCYINTKGS